MAFSLTGPCGCRYSGFNCQEKNAVGLWEWVGMSSFNIPHIEASKRCCGMAGLIKERSAPGVKQEGEKMCVGCQLSKECLCY